MRRRSHHKLGKKIASELYAVFRREGEAGVLPVAKDDVANILRRQLFKAVSVRDTSKFRPQVLTALQGIYTLDEQMKKEGSTAEERFLKSYPFHPDVTEVFYTKCTQLESFQRARGVLRTFAMALQDAAVKDGKLWLTSGPASIFAESVPAGLLTTSARLQAPPRSVSTLDMGKSSQPADEAIARINQLLKDISDDLEFK